MAGQLAGLSAMSSSKTFGKELTAQLKQVSGGSNPKGGQGQQGQGKKKSQGAVKAVATFEALKSAAPTVQEEAEEAAMYRSVEDVERLSQVSERLEAEVLELTKMFKAQAQMIERHRKDIALLLAANTTLKREVESLKASKEAEVVLSHGSRAGHFVAEEEESTSTAPRELKASSLSSGMLPANSVLGNKVASSGIKKRLAS